MVVAAALGPEGVLAVAMPAPVTPGGARTDAEELACNLGIAFDTVPVDIPTTEADVADEAEPLIEEDATVRWERRYARVCLVTLSAIFDERGYLVLAPATRPTSP